MLRILVPTDFSNNSYNALYYAARLFKTKACSFHLVHVCRTDDQRQIEASREDLEAMVHRLVRDVGKNKGHQFEKVSLCSDMTKGIAQYAAEQDMDITVIGNKEKGELKHILFGNNAMQLIRELTTCPVLIVPLEIDFKSVDKLAFTSNYARPIAAKNIKAIRFFSNLMDSVVVPMSIEEEQVAESEKGYKADFIFAISGNSVKEVKLPVFDGKVNTILEFVELWNIDMLCMVYYPHHFFLEFIGKGIIKELNTKLKVPFLILPDARN